MCYYNFYTSFYYLFFFSCRCFRKVYRKKRRRARYVNFLWRFFDLNFTEREREESSQVTGSSFWVFHFNLSGKFIVVQSLLVLRVYKRNGWPAVCFEEIDNHMLIKHRLTFPLCFWKSFVGHTFLTAKNKLQNTLQIEFFSRL